MHTGPFKSTNESGENCFGSTTACLRFVNTLNSSVTRMS